MIEQKDPEGKRKYICMPDLKAVYNESRQTDEVLEVLVASTSCHYLLFNEIRICSCVNFMTEFYSKAFKYFNCLIIEVSISDFAGCV